MHPGCPDSAALLQLRPPGPEPGPPLGPARREEDSQGSSAHFHLPRTGFSTHCQSGPNYRHPSGRIRAPNHHNRCRLLAAHTYECWFCCRAPRSLRVSAVCPPPGPGHIQRPPEPCWHANLLGLLPGDSQQAGGSPGELALPSDDQVPHGPCAQQVPVARGREDISDGILGWKGAASAPNRGLVAPKAKQG